MERIRNKLRRLLEPLGDDEAQRGQTLVILTFAFIGLLTVVGLVTDGALIYVNYGHIRRAADAAAVGAVNQYREGRSIEDIYAAAMETVELQLPAVRNVRVYWCNYEGGSGSDTLTDKLNNTYDPHDPALCCDPHDPTHCPPDYAPRKRVRVEVDLDVTLVFMRILLNQDYITLHSTAEAEAAVLNVVLLLDTSESMANDTCGGLSGQELYDCLMACRTAHNCSPFDGNPSVRQAAYDFVNTLMRDGVDRMAVYHFDKTPVLTQSVETFPCRLPVPPPTHTVRITIEPSSGVVVPLTTNKQDVLDAIMDYDLLNVYVRPAITCESPIQVGGGWGNPGLWTWDDGSPPQTGYGFRWANTNIGGGIREAVEELARNYETGADASVWVIVLLTDGAANTTDIAADENYWYTCPSIYNTEGWPNERSRYSRSGSGGPSLPYMPFCRDPEIDGTVTRHCPNVDACSDPNNVWYTNLGETDPDVIGWSYDADDYARDQADRAAGQGIAIYTIGFGQNVYAEFPTGSGQPRPDAGEQLLRYIADVGDDGRRETAPCGSNDYWPDVDNPPPPPGQDCGNYYYAETADDLQAVFENIASRIFSRLTQ